MGYYASGSGSFHLIGEAPPLEQLVDHGVNVHVYHYDIDVEYDGNYHQDEIEAFMDEIVKYCDRGEFCFVGEEDDHWKFVIENGDWFEYNGKVVYDDEIDKSIKSDDLSEFIGQIIDGVQDVLEETNPNLTIKGATYDKLKDWIQVTLFNWHLI